MSVIDQWADALESGKYEQGRHRLNIDGTFCCLGVLCELAVKAGVIPPGKVVEDDVYAESVVVGYGDDDYASALPPEVVEWAGLDDVDPCYMADGEGEGVRGWSASELNDRLGMSFTQIAACVRRGEA